MDTNTCVGGGPPTQEKNVFKNTACGTEEMARWVRVLGLQDSSSNPRSGSNLGMTDSEAVCPLQGP